MSDLNSILNQFGRSFLITTAPKELVEAVEGDLKSAVGLADYWGGYFTQVTIDDIRALKTWHSQKSQSGGRYVLIASPFFTREAQTALLKITEEPNSDTQIIIVTKNPEDLLPTLRSRLQLVESRSDNEEIVDKAKKFWALSPADRLANVKKFVDLEADNHREQLGDLINQLQQLAVANMTKVKPINLRVLVKAGEFVKVSGLSAKMTYEFLAISLPIFKI
jgi:DNA polymerase-3 subunit delta'